MSRYCVSKTNHMLLRVDEDDYTHYEAYKDSLDAIAEFEDSTKVGSGIAPPPCLGNETNQLFEIQLLSGKIYKIKF